MNGGLKRVVGRCLAPERLARVAEAPLGDDERGHLDACAGCARAAARVQTARTLLREMADADPPDPSPASLVRAEASIRWTRVKPERRAPRVRRSFVWAGGVVALVSAAALAWTTLHPRPATSTQPAATAARTPLLAEPTALTALVTLVGGDVQLVRSGAAARKLGLDTALGPSDGLATAAAGRVAAQWSEGSGFLLYGDAALTLSRLEPRTQRLDLGHGKIAVRVGPHEPGESLQVITPDHVVSVHGTWFTVASAQHVTTVEVLEGTVAVSERQGSAETLLTAPARAVFGRGRTSTAALSAREVAHLRGASEMNLMPWTGLDAARAASGELLVASEPAVADLAVDGVALGSTPLLVRRPLGRHYIELGRAGFAPQQKWVTVGPERGALRVGLVHMPPPPVETVPVEVAEIESMVRRRQAQIRACYERRLKRDPSLAGTVSLRLRVGVAGQVTRVAVEESTLPDPLVGECLRREAAGWSFSVGRNATVVYPFVFRSQ